MKIKQVITRNSREKKMWESKLDVLEHLFDNDEILTKGEIKRKLVEEGNFSLNELEICQYLLETDNKVKYCEIGEPYRSIGYYGRPSAIKKLKREVKRNRGRSFVW